MDKVLSGHFRIELDPSYFSEIGVFFDDTNDGVFRNNYFIVKKWFFNDFSQQKLNFQILKVLSGHFPNNFFKKFFFLKGVFFDDTNDGTFKNKGYILKNPFFGRFLGPKK